MVENPASPNFEGWQKKTAIFLTSQNVSLFGSMLVQYAIIWYVTLTTGSGSSLTISIIAGFLPQILISLFAGVWADRYPRKLLIIGADLLTATSTLILALIFLSGYRELWLLYVVSAIRSVGAGIQMPAVGALLPQIVPSEKLMRVNSISGTINPFIMIAAPVLSGAMLSYARLESIFFIDVVTAALAVGLLISLKVPVHRKAVQGGSVGALDDLKAGLAYIRQHRTVRTLFIFFAFVFFLVTPAAFLTPLLVTRTFGTEIWRLTANEVVFFAGSIIGGFVMMAWGGFKNRFRNIAMGCVIWAVLFVGIGLAGNFYFYLFLMFLAGLPMPFFNVSATTILQEQVREEMQGRVFGVQQLILNTVMPLGMLIFGPLSDRVTIETILIATSGLMAVPGIWLFFSRRPAGLRSVSSGAAVYDAAPGD
jgi:DHA3 family macrolide efflux protein-like MFS transporter